MTLETYGIQPMIWGKWTRAERVAALAYLFTHAPLMKASAVTFFEPANKTSGKGDHLVARIQATKTAGKLRNHLGDTDTKILWSVICAQATLSETAAWLFGDAARHISYTSRRCEDALASSTQFTIGVDGDDFEAMLDHHA